MQQGACVVVWRVFIWTLLTVPKFEAAGNIISPLKHGFKRNKFFKDDKVYPTYYSL